METAKTIVVTSCLELWEQAQRTGEYTQSTLTSTLEEVGFIHCSFPDQTLEIVNRKFRDRNDLVLLLVDVTKVKPTIKYEDAPSGRPGTFPHVYGPLNVDAVYAIVSLERDSEGVFITPAEFRPLLLVE